MNLKNVKFVISPPKINFYPTVDINVYHLANKIIVY